MKYVNIPLAALAAVVVAAALCGCGDTKCKMDTECPLPEVCMAGSCVPRSMDGTTTDTAFDSVFPDGVDTVGDTPTEGDAPEDTVEEDTVVGPCTPEFLTLARAIWGSTSVHAGQSQEDPDRPNMVILDGEAVWVQSRIWVDPGEPATVPKLVHRQVNPRTANAGSVVVTSLGSVTLDRYHPAIGTSGGIVSVFHDLAGISANQMMWQIQPDPMDSGTVLRGGFTNSDAASTHPAVAASGTQILTVWRQDNGAGMSSLRYGIVDFTGTEVATGVVYGDDTANLETPVLAFNGTGYGLAYAVHAGEGLDRVEFLELDADASLLTAMPLSWTVTEGTSVIPRNDDRTFDYGDPVTTVTGDPSTPALVWNGSQYLLLFEEASSTGEVSGPSHLHAKIIAAGGGTTLAETTVEDDVAAAVTPEALTVTGRQDGMFDAAWNGTHYGVVWVHEDTSSGSSAWYFALDTNGELIINANSPHNVNSTGSQTFHPSIGWYEDSNDRWFVFVWDEYRTSAPPGHVTYTLSYGCDY